MIRRDLASRGQLIESQHINLEAEVRERARVARDQLFLVAIEGEVEGARRTQIHDLHLCVQHQQLSEVQRSPLVKHVGA